MSELPADTVGRSPAPSITFGKLPREINPLTGAFRSTAGPGVRRTVNQGLESREMREHVHQRCSPRSRVRRKYSSRMKWFKNTAFDSFIVVDEATTITQAQFHPNMARVIFISDQTQLGNVIQPKPGDNSLRETVWKVEKLIWEAAARVACRSPQYRLLLRLCARSMEYYPYRGQCHLNVLPLDVHLFSIASQYG